MSVRDAFKGLQRTGFARRVARRLESRVPPAAAMRLPVCLLLTVLSIRCDDFQHPVAAFANFRRILRPSGALAFSCWRSLLENELDYLPLSAAGVQSTVDESPFSFADPEHIRRTLEAAGFSEIIIQPYDEKVSSGDLDAMACVLLKVGPLGKIVRENPALRATAEPLLREALAALGDPSRVHLLASIWIVTARAGALAR